jgi:phenylpropionate dioxygenase-like ring-hydroxylating dioxygenase large terminal subunit
MWRNVASSADVHEGETLAITVEDRELVLWRSMSGRLAACDRRCPHQWADLDASGAVDGEELVCLSHFWRFALDGAGTKLSVTGRRDEKAPIEVREVREVDGRVELRLC